MIMREIIDSCVAPLQRPAVSLRVCRCVHCHLTHVKEPGLRCDAQDDVEEHHRHASD